MHARQRERSRTLTALAIGVTLMLVSVLGVWGAHVNAQAASGNFSGSASTDLVHIEAVDVPESLKLAEVSIAPAMAEMSSAEMSSEGLEDKGNSVARAANLDFEALNGSIDETLLVEASHEALDETEGPVEEALGEVPADPVLNASLAKASALARWVADGCVPIGTPIATSTSELLDAKLITGTPAGESVVALHNSVGGTVFSKATTEFVSIEGSANRGVRSVAQTQLTGVTFFENTPNEFTVNVIAPPVVEAVATGMPGGAEVTYDQPVLQVIDANGEVIGELNGKDANQEIDASPVAKLRIGYLDSSASEDGTKAEGRAVLFEAIIFDDPEQVDPLASLSIAAGEVAASVPAGGVDCDSTTPVLDSEIDDGVAVAGNEIAAPISDASAAADQEVAVGEGSSNLPATGAPIAGLVAAGLAMLAVGEFLRRRSRSGTA